MAESRASSSVFSVVKMHSKSKIGAVPPVIKNHNGSAIDAVNLFQFLKSMIRTCVGIVSTRWISSFAKDTAAAKGTPFGALALRLS